MKKRNASEPDTVAYRLVKPFLDIGKTQSWIAEQIDIGTTSVNRWANGGGGSGENLEKMKELHARYFGADGVKIEGGADVKVMTHEEAVRAAFEAARDANLSLEDCTLLVMTLYRKLGYSDKEVSALVASIAKQESKSR